MKKATILFILLIAATASVFALDNWTFDIVPTDGVMFKEPYADPYAFGSKIHVQKSLDPTNQPAKIRTAVEAYKDGVKQDVNYVDLAFDNSLIEEPEKNSIFLHMRMGDSVSLLRFTYAGNEKLPKMEFEVTAGGALNTLFNLEGNSNCLGFDGTWLAAINTRIADRYVIRLGMHHFSGHYGDEILEKYYEYNRMSGEVVDGAWKLKINGDFEGKESGIDYYYHNVMEYVRDNSWIAGFSADLPLGFRVYTEVEMPWKNVWLRPFADAPAFSQTQDKKPLLDYLGRSSEGFTDSMVDEEIARKKGTGYLALRVHLGGEYTYQIKNVGLLYAAADLQLHQDGQTKHMANQYKKSNPWEYEITAVTGITLGKELFGHNTSIELCYHDGRTTTTDFYYQRAKTISIGMAIR